MFLGWAKGCVSYLDEVLAFGLRHEGLQFGGGERVDQPGLRHDEKQDLGACQHREFVGLHTGSGLATGSSIEALTRRREACGCRRVGQARKLGDGAKNEPSS